MLDSVLIFNQNLYFEVAYSLYGHRSKGVRAMTPELMDRQLFVKIANQNRILTV
jgi:hypothetical protein